MNNTGIISWHYISTKAMAITKEWTLQFEKKPNNKTQTKPTGNLKLKGYSTQLFTDKQYNYERFASLFTE